ncbi:MAG: DNA-directed RNA polymerase subunit beta' [Candidatus Brennerbacteria bacterium]|nr:DNA-directed RNA polymerase subunit beta' [Candidatus Brennerbacteria bacterium]
MISNRNIDVKSISINIASPEEILRWSHGEVTKPETLNYRTQRPEKDGLFSERIFGPTKDYECYCGKYKKIRYKGVVCEKCGVEVTRAQVRRERMGHITLESPVTHIWFLKTVPSKLSLLLDISVPKLEKVIYYAAFIVTAVNEEARDRALQKLKAEFKSLKKEKSGDFDEARKKQEEILSVLRPGLILTEAEYHSLARVFGDVFEADRGGGAVRKILEGMNLQAVVKDLKKELEGLRDANRKRRVLQRLRLVTSLIKAKTRPEWMVLTVLPVLPPELRPMVALDGGRYATADLNDLYRRVINRNNRLKKLIELKAPDVIITNEKRMLQEAVDALIDNTASTGQILSSRRRPLRSLADLLKGKQGRFRQNLLGKRVDYSGRSVIVVGPELKLNECGLPKNLALELFRPFVIWKIIERGYAYNIKQANRLIEQGTPDVWAILEEVIEGKKVLLNRAPTLHRLGIQAFNPRLIEDLAIRIPPLVCTAFNADFDGDQMAVHLPLTVEAQYEAGRLMDAGKNLLKPANGEPIVSPTQDVVLGIYHLTEIRPGATGEGKAFSSFSEATLAYEADLLDLNAKIKIPVEGKIVETSYGRLLFNRELPADFGFVNDHLNKKALAAIVSEIINRYGIEVSHGYLDRIKDLGFRYATYSAASWGIADTAVPAEKEELIKRGNDEVAAVQSQFQEGLLTERERQRNVISIWTRIWREVNGFVVKGLDSQNSIYKIVSSGARGNWNQLGQIMGMKGLMTNPKNETIELPVKTSLKEGHKILEYFISTHGARKGSTDTALKTASAGYLTRRLVDVAQDLIVKERDCRTKEGIELTKKEGKEFGYPFAERLYSRTALEDVKIDRKTVVKAGEIIGRAAAQRIGDSGIESIRVRSPITCKTLYGICAACYGGDLTTEKPVEIGEAVGIIAAQSIGEPGTQLTMRTFHIGGVAGVDITVGLPRVEELFEARPPKGKAVIAKEDGRVEAIEERGSTRIVKVKEEKVNEKSKKKKALQEYLIPAAVNLLVKEGDEVKKGEPLNEGPMDLRELMSYQGIDDVKRYIVSEVQKIYIPEGTSINDKHIEIIVRQMLGRVLIKEAGDTDFMVGDIVEKSKFKEVNRAMKRAGKVPAKGVQLIMGITRASLTTESFLSAASFQETSRVLVNAACEGRVDTLRGLKENVIIGKLIPVGTGFRSIDAKELALLKEKFYPAPPVEGGGEGAIDVVEKV